MINRGEIMAKKELSKSAKKKLLIILGCVLLVIVILLAIPRSTYEKLFNKTDVIINNPNEESGPYQIVYVKNKNQQLVGLKLKVETIEEDQIKQKWELLTSKVNSYPKDYSSPIETSSVLEKYDLIGEILTLYVNQDFCLSDGKEAIASIAWTFCDDTVKEVVIKVNNQVIKKLGEYEFEHINKSITVNYVFETAYLYESEYVTIIYYEQDYIYPVTYFYRNKSIGDFIVCKLLDEELINNQAYSFELSEDGFVVNLAYDEILSDDAIKEFSETVKYNLDVESLIINNNVMTIYEESFVKVSEPSSGETTKKITAE